MIGIIAAEEKEMIAIKDNMTNILEEEIFELKFLKGTMCFSRMWCRKSECSKNYSNND